MWDTCAAQPCANRAAELRRAPLWLLLQRARLDLCIAFIDSLASFGSFLFFALLLANAPANLSLDWIERLALEEPSCLQASDCGFAGAARSDTSRAKRQTALASRGCGVADREFVVFIVHCSSASKSGGRPRETLGETSAGQPGPASGSQTQGGGSECRRPPLGARRKGNARANTCSASRVIRHRRQSVRKFCGEAKLGCRPARFL